MSDPLFLLVSFFVSLVGFALYRYGRRASRPPHLIGGIVLMVTPWLMPSALWGGVVSVAIGGLVLLAIRFGL